jgi:hypothetical protein
MSQELGPECAEGPQPGKLLRVEGGRGGPGEGVLQPREDREAAAERLPPEEHVEDDTGVLTGEVVALQHRELVEVSQEPRH